MESTTTPQKRTLWSEVAAGIEWAGLKLSPVYYGVGVPRGDGSAVVLVPGFLSHDLAVTELHLWLGRLGYKSYRSGLGLVADCPDAMLDRLYDTIDRAYEETGRPVHLVGHSLGGLLARAAAAHKSDKVAQVVTMGTPFRRMRAHPLVQGGMRRVLRRSKRESGRPCLRSFNDGLKKCLPPGLPHVAIYSKTDPVVDWQDCQVDGGVNIEVSGTHSGLPYNPEVYRRLGALLAPPEHSPRFAAPPLPPGSLPLAA